LEAQLIRFINGTLLRGDGNVDRDTRLFEEGHINSLRILELIAAVEKAIGAKIPDRAVRLANFRTVATIVRTFHPSAEKEASPPTSSSDRVFEQRRDRARFALPLGALVERGDITLASAGQVSLAGAALDVMLAVDQTVQRWARELGAAEHRYPSLIAADVLRRAGRDEWTSVIPSERSESRNRTRPDRGPSLYQDAGDSSTPAASARNDMALAPAVCYHAYPEYESKTLGENPIILTALGRCYRHEGGNHVPLERLWEFNMREVIVLGTREQVEATRQQLVRHVADLVNTLDLDASIEVAADPFFTSADEGRRLMQQAGALKHELQLTLEPSGRAIAAASFNHHLDYFGSRFGIEMPNGSPAYSGCVAFGLERWVLAIFSQLSVDEIRWPASAREWLRDARHTLARA
jgi:seryl-tRNA synthetase